MEQKVKGVLIATALWVGLITLGNNARAAAEVSIKLDNHGLEREITFQFVDFTEAVEFLQSKAEDRLAETGQCDPRINRITITQKYIEGLD